MKYEGTIILRHGSRINLQDWQHMYGLEVGSNKVGNFFRIGEKNLQGKVVIKNGFVISELVILMNDMIRELRGKPTIINSFDRTEEEQDDLRARGYRAATTSPHVAKMASDVDEKNPTEVIILAKAIAHAARRLRIKVRIGYQKYLKDGSTFVHYDVCPEYYAPGKPFHNEPHPQVWEVEARW
ncbi:hypothetical protein KDU71_07365 [Carboxylicivirga sediminis]|uniref:Peptidase M15A C-terminal domain-containing protein n=1 Tax=Carboxylicivirga sediminis TaxID=2006564 RepID=A0A941F308_9BACT|nr:hypothetical protein [Carboxylicivirga sediminis]MBR8535374.1 hypothetical protein [Carboxylicivirga sediminis]